MTSIYQVVSIFMEAGVAILLLWRRVALGKMAPEPMVFWFVNAATPGRLQNREVR